MSVLIALDAFNDKVISAAALFMVAYVCAWLPLKFAAMNDHLLHMGNAFSGGVLVSVAIVHMLADASDDLESLGNSINRRFGGDPDDSFPLGNAVFVGGLFFMLASQIITQAVVGNDEPELLLDEYEQPPESSAGMGMPPKLDKGDGSVSMAYSGGENQEPLLSVEERKEALGVEAEDEILNADNEQQDGDATLAQICGPPMMLCLKCSGIGKVIKMDEHGCIEMKACPLCNGGGKIKNQAQGLTSHNHDHGKHVPRGIKAPAGHEVIRVAYLPIDNQLQKIITVAPAQHCCLHRKGEPLTKLRQVLYSPPLGGTGVSQHQALASLVTLVALSLHSIIEGLAAGAAKNQAQAFSIVGAIACHKGFAAFALSSLMLPLRRTSGRHCRGCCDPWLLSTIWFALASPLAIVVGAFMEKGLSGTSVALLICMASGTLAFIGISEMLLPSLSKASPGNSIWKLVLAVTGAFGMTFLAIYC